MFLLKRLSCMQKGGICFFFLVAFVRTCLVFVMRCQFVLPSARRTARGRFSVRLVCRLLERYHKHHIGVEATSPQLLFATARIQCALQSSLPWFLLFPSTTAVVLWLCGAKFT